MAEPDDAGQARARAEHLLDLHRPEEARRVLVAALAQAPDNLELLCVSAQAELAAGDPERARTMAARAVHAAPDSEWALRLLALTSSRSGRSQEAMVAGERAVAAAPWLWQTHHVMAHVSMDTPGQTVRAWDAARRAVELAPLEADTHTVMGSVALKAGDKVTAERALHEALRLDPSNAVAMNELGRLRLRNRDHVGAATHFANAAGTDTRLDVAAHNIDVALTAAAAKVFVLAWLVLIFPARFALTLTGEAAVVSGLVTLAALVGIVLWQGVVLRPLLQSRLRTYVLLLPHRDRGLTAVIGLTALGILSLALMGVMPLGVRWPFAAVGAVALVVCRIVLFVRARRLNRRTRAS